MTDHYKGEEPKTSRWKSIVKFSGDYIVEEWPSALLVVALVTIAKLQFNWLAAIDSYAFLALGSLSTTVTESSQSQSKAVVVLIDEHTHEQRFRERSPLDRCVLHDHIEKIYQRDPGLLAIDLDLSPIRGESPQEAGCQHKLEKLIQASSKTIPTILLRPFAAERDSSTRYSSDAITRAEDWVYELAKDADRDGSQLYFGSGRLPVAYGLLLKHFTRADSFANIARRLVMPGKEDRHGKALSDRTNPRSYTEGLKIVPIQTEPGHADSFPERLGAAVADVEKNTSSKAPVFLGAGYGADDKFLTPLGLLFGVEAHAAVFAAQGVEERAILDAGLEVLIAIGLGIVIAGYWDQYYRRRFSDDPTKKQRARFSIIKLAGWMLFLTFSLTVVSTFLLAEAGLWLSPIPIAVGMLLDSFVSGSVDRGVEAGKKEKLALIERLKKLAMDYSVRQALQDEAHKIRFRPKVPLDPLTRHLGVEILYLLNRKAYMATLLLSMWTCLWLGAVVRATYLIFHH